ncbi:MAG: 6-phosphogluconate dehydrogenase [Thermomicrobiales bacterium]|nr:6-phosphogluconate dehydrogenase [Thermomicrobiales bacterium]
MTVATRPATRAAAMTTNRHVGVIGLAVMGENLAINIARNGYPIAVYNRTLTRTEEFLATRAPGYDVRGAFAIQEFIDSLATPRCIIVMVKAGAPVDAVLAELTPFLDPDDIVIDGGNSFFQDTERRAKETAGKFRFVGMGISGGEEGALWGPSLMPGGPAEAYAILEPMLVAIAAKTEAGPCVTHIGPGGAGHYVKMVHNGIEYGDMQLIAETYDVMKRALGMNAREISEVFARWNKGKLESYLIEITAEVLAFVDVETDAPLVDVIVDTAEQKGTGRWTSQNALELATPIPTIDAAVFARSISAMKERRVAASKVLIGPDGSRQSSVVSRQKMIDALEDGLFFAKISSYAQGMALLRAASETYHWDLNLSEIARIWKGGCIIRAKLLDPIRVAFAKNPELENLLLAPHITESVNSTSGAAREVAATAIRLGIPAPAHTASLGYVDSYRTARLPANLTQGQRDYFGAHTYRRLDRPGTFHTVWTPVGTEETVASEPSTRTAWAEGAGEGDRSPRKGAAPVGAKHAVVEPPADRAAPADPEDEGQRSPEASEKAEY